MAPLRKMGMWERGRVVYYRPPTRGLRAEVYWGFNSARDAVYKLVTDLANRWLCDRFTEAEKRNGSDARMR